MRGPPIYNLIPPIPSQDFDKLTLSNSDNLVKLDYIRHLKKLKILEMYNVEVEDLSPIKDFYDLEILKFNCTKVKDLEPLKNLTNLRELEFDSTRVTSLKPIENLEKLKRLHFIETPVDDLSPVQNLLKLSSLWCAGTKISDLSPIAEKDLTELCFSNTVVTDLIPIATLNNLSWLMFTVSPGIDTDKLQTILDILNTQNDDISIFIDKEKYNDCSVSTNNIIEIKTTEKKPIHGLPEFKVL